eukprot:483205-Rhodomonas_salina.1
MRHTTRSSCSPHAHATVSHRTRSANAHPTLHTRIPLSKQLRQWGRPAWAGRKGRDKEAAGAAVIWRTISVSTLHQNLSVNSPSHKSWHQ